MKSFLFVLLMSLTACGDARDKVDTRSSQTKALATVTDTDFPLAHKPLETFWEGIRAFGAQRNGRKHAAVDLYSAVGRGVLSVAEGVVLDHYYFYSGTNAVVVKHKFLGRERVVRYGEISKLGAGVAKNTAVKKGQLLAHVGKMHCCKPMLHFELFEGSATGPLTNRNQRPFQRRSDLLDPTEFMKTLQRDKGWL